jgi:hypothetical protein
VPESVSESEIRSFFCVEISSVLRLESRTRQISDSDTDSDWDTKKKTNAVLLASESEIRSFFCIEIGEENSSDFGLGHGLGLGHGEKLEQMGWEQDLGNRGRDLGAVELIGGAGVREHAQSAVKTLFIDGALS